MTTLDSTSTIRLATRDDLPALVQLRTDAEQWLRELGSDQWHNHARGVRAMRAGVEAGETYVLTTDDTVVATVSLGGPDWDFWAAEDNPHDALYLYKLITARSIAGHGIGGQLIEWSAEQAALAGKQWLRLDCWRENTKLHDYYRAHDFTYLRTVRVPGRGSGALFQRPVQ